MIVAKTPARRSANLRLSGLGVLDTNKLMIKGGQYTFHFTFGLLGLRVSPADITKAILSDANFARPVATLPGDGTVSVSFIYNGRGSTIGNAAAEMQSVINHFGVVGLFNRLDFSSADGPDSPIAPGSAGGPPPVDSPDAATPASGPGFNNAALWQLMNPATPQALSTPATGTISWGTVGLIGGGFLLATLAVYRMTRS
jgi:hypothetical protein